MLIEFEAYKEKKNEKGIPDLYLLRSQSDKSLFCVVKIENDTPELYESSFTKNNSEIDQEGWEQLSDSRKNIENFLIENMDADSLVELENNFMKPDETNEEKTYLIDFNQE